MPLHVAGVLAYAVIFEAVALGYVDGAALEGRNRASFGGDSYQVRGMQARRGVVDVDLVLQARHIRIDGRDIGVHANGNPLMARELLEVPYLIRIANPDLVAILRSLLIDDGAKELYALACRGSLGEHDVGDVVFADAVIEQRVDATAVVSVESTVTPFSLMPASE